jgi:hypothetical protein
MNEPRKKGERAETFSIDECDEAFVRDFMPYKGSPDPHVVWRAAWKSARESRASAGPDAEPVHWGYAGTVGNYIKQLQTLDPGMPIYAGMHADYKGKRCAMVRGLTLSRERVVGRFIDPARTDIPYSAVVWAAPDESTAGREAPTSAPDHRRCDLGGHCVIGDERGGDHCGTDECALLGPRPIENATPQAAPAPAEPNSLEELRQMLDDWIATRLPAPPAPDTKTIPGDLNDLARYLSGSPPQAAAPAGRQDDVMKLKLGFIAALCLYLDEVGVGAMFPERWRAWLEQEGDALPDAGPRMDIGIDNAIEAFDRLAAQKEGSSE